MGFYDAIRPLLFRLPPETAHGVAKGALRFAQAIGPLRATLERRFEQRYPSLAVDCLDLTFPSPVGIAAGFDKNAEVAQALAALGFGFVEIGTVTPRPQPGNPQPRLFRIPQDDALINHLGFNSQGADRVRSRLRKHGPPSVPLGINIGKMNDSDEAQAIDDYRRVYDTLAEFADYVVVNVSCPNTPEEFDQQEPGFLHEVFSMLTAGGQRDTPVLVKVGPDEDERGLTALVDTVESHDIDGIIATNTTDTRDGLTRPHRDIEGGLSGPPLEPLANHTIRTLSAHTDLPIIGVGGVDDAESAYRKIRAGATLVQLYTGFVYGGPALASRINEGLVERLDRDGFDTVSEAVGVEAS